MRLLARSVHAGRLLWTSSIDLKVRALKKRFFTNPTAFSMQPFDSGSAFLQTYSRMSCSWRKSLKAFVSKTSP